MSIVLDPSSLQFEIPEYLSPDAVELISSVLVKDPKLRPTIDQVLVQLPNLCDTYFS